MAFIHPFDDPVIVAGQGSLGLELLTQVPDISRVIVPVGGGGLISGIAVALRSERRRRRGHRGPGGVVPVVALVARGRRRRHRQLGADDRRRHRRQASGRARRSR